MQYIKHQIEDRVARITFADPPLNIFSIAMMKEINAVLTDCMNRSELVAVVFDAVPESRAFSAGVSIEEHAEDTIYQMLEHFHGIFRNLVSLARPAIAVIDGVALGGGCELALACDIVIASDRTRLGQPEIKLGVLPPVACALLPAVIGDKRARELILTGELIDSTEAMSLGMINYVVPRSALEVKTSEILSRLRELSGKSLESARRAIDIARGRPFADALTAIEDIYLNELMKTSDAREGIEAFIQKRKPNWRNR